MRDCVHRIESKGTIVHNTTNYLTVLLCSPYQFIQPEWFGSVQDITGYASHSPALLLGSSMISWPVGDGVDDDVSMSTAVLLAVAVAVWVRDDGDDSSSDDASTFIVPPFATSGARVLRIVVRCACMRRSV